MIKRHYTSSNRSREEVNGKTNNDNNHNRDQTHDRWGDKMMKKKNNHTRLCFANINGIGVSKKSSKSEEIRMFMSKKQVDVMGMAETNVNWSKVTNSNTLWERTQSWFETRRIAVAYNTHDKIGKNRRCLRIL